MNLTLLIPELSLTVLALGVMLWDLWLPKEKKDLLCWASMAIMAGLFALTFLPDLTSAAANAYDATSWPQARALNGSFILDGMALLMKRAFCVTGFFVFFMSKEYVDEMPRGQGEFYTISLLALLGMFLCSSVNDFMSLFVALEVVTVSFFVLAAFKRSPKSVEAGLKLLVIGSLSAAVLLYGIAFVYGATGTLDFDPLRQGLASGGIRVSTELLFGAILVFLGLGFKTSAVPLHVWVPDVYQGAPTPVTAFLSVGSKLAGFVLVLRCFTVFSASSALAPELANFFALVAALTLFYGNLGAIPQTDIKRLMGYSSIGQCGYILIGIAAGWSTGLAGALFYMTAYVLTNLAAFMVILFVARTVGSHDIDDYAGLGKRSPILALTLTGALLSLAGVPPMIGFFGKFMLLGSAFGNPELRWLVVVGLINVVIGLYYYLCVIKRIYIHEPKTPTAPVVPARLRLAMMAATVALIVGGMAPGLLERPVAEIARDLPIPQQPSD